ncbi:MAG: hypothetical protein ACTS5A_01535 [Candidatus Hodgkinia cicadicola]
MINICLKKKRYIRKWRNQNTSGGVFDHSADRLLRLENDGIVIALHEDI